MKDKAEYLHEKLKQMMKTNRSMGMSDTVSAACAVALCAEVARDEFLDNENKYMYTSEQVRARLNKAFGVDDE